MNQVKIPLEAFRAAIFDMDGTMINNMLYHQRAWQKFLERHDTTFTEEEFKHKISGKKNDQIFELVFGDKPSPDDLLAYTEEKEAIYRELYEPEIKEVAGLSDLINQFEEKNIRIAIATTAPKKNRDFALVSLGLEGKFEVILGDEHVTHGKPDPEIYLSTAKELGVAPKECIVFEDSPPGVKAGKNAGMAVVGILTTHSAHELAEADYFVNDFSELRIV